MNHPVRKKGLLAALIVFFCFALTPVAWGQDAARNVPKGQADEARALFKEGVQAQRDADWEKAYDALRKSYNLRRSFDTAANLGVVEVELKRYPAAAEHLDYWLRHYPTSEDPERYSRVQALFEQVRPLVGGVKVEVNVAGARIFVDGESVGTSPIEREIFVKAGKHSVRAELQGKETSTHFDVAKGATAEVRLTLEEGSSQPASGLDEEESTFGEDPQGEAEPHRVKRNWVPAYVLGGVTVAAFGTSMVFRGLVGAKANQLDELTSADDDRCSSASSADCSELAAVAKKHDQFLDVSNVSLIVAGVAAATTVGYITYALAKKPKKPSVRAGIGIDSSGGILVFDGQF